MTDTPAPTDKDDDQPSRRRVAVIDPQEVPERPTDPAKLSRFIRNRNWLTAIAVTVGLALATGCTEYPEGPAGRVVDKDRDYKASTKTWKYELTVQTAKGETEFRVSRSNYNDCVRGATYPKCAKG